MCIRDSPRRGARHELLGRERRALLPSTLVQTLFYGLFAAWVFWAEHHEHTDVKARFRWREAASYLHIPILQKLFYDFANPAQLGALKLDEVLDWACLLYTSDAAD